MSREKPVFWGRVGVLGLLLWAVPVFFSSETLGQFTEEFREIDGSGNNRDHPDWGAARRELLRLVPSAYGNGRSSPAGTDRPWARAISNAVVAQAGSIPNLLRASDFVWQWGQFLDHDLSLTVVIDPAEPLNIPVPAGDPEFDPQGTASQIIPLHRSFYNVVDGVRQQVNELTSYIDASNVYGSDKPRAMELRTLDGTGRLKTSEGDLLPFNLNGFPNSPSPAPSFFLAGDFRSNEQVALTAMHVLFVREHNFWADALRSIFPGRTGEEIYQLARTVVAAEMQVITYREFLPVLLGPNALDPYTGYDPEVNVTVANVFSTAAFRFGHSMLSPILLRLDERNRTIAAGPLELFRAFFDPKEIQRNGIEPLLRGLAFQTAQNVDSFVVDGVRNLLFGPPRGGGLDLPALNIQRGRDHGLPGYNRVRAELGLVPAARFEDVNPDPLVHERLASVYETVDDIDVWVGGLAEPQLPGALVGELFFVILKDQFQRLRDGDRFWYELQPFLTGWVERQTLSEIIRRNTSIDSEIQDNVFLVPVNSQKTLHFAQFANGKGVVSGIVLTNPSDSQSVFGEIFFYDDEGLPVMMGMADEVQQQSPGPAAGLSPLDAGHSIRFTLRPGTTQTIATDGQGNTVICSAVVKADRPLDGVVQFSMDGLGSAKLEVSTPLEGFVVPVRRSGQLTTGIAFHNVEDRPVVLNLTLRDTRQRTVPNGKRMGVELPPSAHLARLIEQLFPEADTSDFLGSLMVEVSGGRVAAAALELGKALGELRALSVTRLE